MPVRRQCATVVAAAVALAAAVSAAFASAPGAAATTPAWGTMGPLHLGMSQGTIYRRYGFGTAHSSWLWTTYRLLGGSIDVSFLQATVTSLRCAAPGFFHGGGCPRGYVLPDAVRIGSVAPAGAAWRGYTRTASYPLSGVQIWQKTIRASGRAIHVEVDVLQGTVGAISQHT